MRALFGLRSSNSGEFLAIFTRFHLFILGNDVIAPCKCCGAVKKALISPLATLFRAPLGSDKERLWSAKGLSWSWLQHSTRAFAWDTNNKCVFTLQFQGHISAVPYWYLKHIKFHTRTEIQQRRTTTSNESTFKHSNVRACQCGFLDQDGSRSKYKMDQEANIGIYQGATRKATLHIRRNSSENKRANLLSSTQLDLGNRSKHRLLLTRIKSTPPSKSLYFLSFLIFPHPNCLRSLQSTRSLVPQ